MLVQFTQWAMQLSHIAEEHGFDVDVTVQEKYFTKICIDSNSYVSQIVCWENHNLYEAEILNVETSETVYMKSGEFEDNTSFSEFFCEFLVKLKLPTI